MQLINAEQTALRVLGFDIDVPMPLNFLLTYAQQKRCVHVEQSERFASVGGVRRDVDSVCAQFLHVDGADRSQTRDGCVL